MNVALDDMRDRFYNSKYKKQEVDMQLLNQIQSYSKEVIKKREERSNWENAMFTYLSWQMKGMEPVIYKNDHSFGDCIRVIFLTGPFDDEPSYLTIHILGTTIDETFKDVTFQCRINQWCGSHGRININSFATAKGNTFLPTLAQKLAHDFPNAIYGKSKVEESLEVGRQGS